jgi:ribosomal protein L15
MGATIQPEREKRLQMDAKRKKGKPVLFRYDPSVSKTSPKFIFTNSSGNPIIKDVNLQLLEKNLNKNIEDELKEQEENEVVDEVESTNILLNDE